MKYITIKSLGVISAGLFVALVVSVSYALIKRSDVKVAEANNESLKMQLTNAKNANKSNLKTIASLQDANRQCVLEREANSNANESELKAHQARIALISKDYEQLQVRLNALGGCANMRIGADVVRMLQDADNRRD